MAWEWSHSPEAYELARKKLAKKAEAWLTECLAENKASTKDEHHNYEFDMELYEKVLKEIKYSIKKFKEAGIPCTVCKENLADQIWQYAKEIRTTDNGGFLFWMCPFGCHTVPAEKDRFDFND